MTEMPTVAQLIARLDRTDRARLIAVFEDRGTYRLPTSEGAVERWSDAREDIVVREVIDGPLQGWTSEDVVWQYAIRFEGRFQPDESFYAFVGFDQSAPDQEVTA